MAGAVRRVHLRGLNELKTFDLNNTKGIVTLQKALPNCKIVRFAPKK